MVQAAIRRSVSYVTIGPVLYRVQAVDAVKLAEVGLAYLQGLREAEPEVVTQAEAQIRAEAASAEDAEAKIATYKERERDRAMRMHRAAIATPEGAAAYLERVRAYVLAGVTGMGEAPEVPESVSEGVPGVIHHGANWEPPEGLSRVTLEDAPQPEGPIGEVLEEYARQNLWPLWALEPATCAILATLIASLAGGRADLVAPFRTGQRAGGNAGPAGAEVPHRSMDGASLGARESDAQSHMHAGG